MLVFVRLPLTMLTSVLIIFFLNSLEFNEAARILVVIPTPSVSHQLVFRPLTQELAKRGHELTVITTDPAFPKGQTPANLTEVDLHEISYEIWNQFYLTSTGIKSDLTNQIKVGLELFNVIFEKQVKTKEVQELLKKDKHHFDLLIVEACFRQALVFSHVFKAPVIQMSSFGAMLGNYELMGGPTHPLMYPMFISQKINNLTLWDKITELYTYYSILNIYEGLEESENEMLRRNFGHDVPPLSKLKENVDMLFLNIHPLIEGNFPVPPSVQYIWGIHGKTEKELPKDLQNYLDSSKHGVIYMSFGTNTDPTLLPLEKIQVFLRVFSKLPYDVLWKWNGDELPGRTDNIKIGKWFPQSDLLRHPKLKLFVTQGGIQSTDEAITAGVPLVGIPMVGDQWYNVGKYVQLKIGVGLDLETISDEIFREAVTTVIDDKSYRENIVRLNTLMRDQPERPLMVDQLDQLDQLNRPLQRAVWWTERVLRHGGASHLRAPAANLPWTQYYQIELVFMILSGLTILLSLIVCIMYLAGVQSDQV